MAKLILLRASTMLDRKRETWLLALIQRRYEIVAFSFSLLPRFLVISIITPSSFSR